MDLPIILWEDGRCPDAAIWIKHFECCLTLMLSEAHVCIEGRDGKWIEDGSRFKSWSLQFFLAPNIGQHIEMQLLPTQQSQQVADIAHSKLRREAANAVRMAHNSKVSQCNSQLVNIGNIFAQPHHAGI